MSLEGGQDWNASIRYGREGVSTNRDALIILRHNISEAIKLNADNPDLITFLLGLAAQVDRVAAGTDKTSIALEELWAYGAQQKIKRKKRNDE